MPGGVRTEIHLVSQNTGGAFCMLLDEPPVGWSLPAHLYRDAAETIHILEGDFEMDIEGVRSRQSPGDNIHIPRGRVHSGANVGSGPGRRIVLFSPAGMEGFFLEAGVGGPEESIDLREALACATRHGWEFVGAG
jgi:quercetin dioxygenase-like cupin family protein